jgi:pimeloyl-ACP methyl ester carboxylesterase
MSIKKNKTLDLPYLLPGRIVTLPNRGEMFIRHHLHADANAPTLLLLHGWTASSDTQFFTAYEALAAEYSIVGVDHRGHGRGLRPDVPFSLEDCADDAADVLRALGINEVITVGYSMGGPISMLFWQRHTELVKGMVLQATALEWNGTRRERTRWKVGHVLGPVFRLVTTSPRFVRFLIKRALPRGHELRHYAPWIVGEIRRNDAWMVAEAGRALSHFNATSFAAGIQVPVAFMLTLQDRLVPPEKQRALAATTRANIFELDDDHFAPLTMPREFASVMRQCVDDVRQRV